MFGFIGALRGGISQKQYVSIEMQGDRLSLRHIGDVQGWAGHAESEVRCGDGRGVIRERVGRRAGLERNAHGMRSNRVGLEQIGKEPGGVERAGIEAGCGDGWVAIGEHDACVVNRRARLEHNAGCEPKSDLDCLQLRCTEPALAKRPIWAGLRRTRWDARQRGGIHRHQ